MKNNQSSKANEMLLKSIRIHEEILKTNSLDLEMIYLEIGEKFIEIWRYNHECT